MADTDVSFAIRASAGTAVAETEAAARAMRELVAVQSEQAAKAAEVSRATMAVTHTQVRAAVAIQATGAASGIGAAGVGQLRLQLVDMGQMLALGQNPLTMLMQQGPQAAQALALTGQAGMTMGQSVKAALGPLAAFGPALAVVGVAAAGLGAAYLYLNGQLEEANEKAAAAAKLAGEMQAATEGWRGAVADLDEAMGLATGDLDKYDILARRTTEAIDAGAVATRKALQDRITAAETSLSVARREEEGITAALESVRARREDLADFEAKVARKKLVDIPALVAAQMEADAKGNESTKRKVATIDKLIDKEEEYRRLHLKVTEMEIAAAAKQMDDAPFAARARGEFAEFANALDQLVPPEALTDLERLAELGERVQEAFATGKISTEQFAALQSALAGKTATAQAAALPSSADKMGKTAATVGGALSDPLGTIGGMHQIAGAVIAGLRSAASMQDGRSVFTEAAELVVNALENLPDFVGSAVEAAGKIIAEAPVALVKGLPALIAGIADALPTLVDSMGTLATGLVVALAEALPALLPPLIRLVATMLITMTPLLILSVAEGLIRAFTDPEFYAAIARAFIEGLEQLVDGLLSIIKDIVPSEEPAGGTFDLFAGTDLQTVPKSQVVISPGDLWGDFTKAIGIETGAQGRA